MPIRRTCCDDRSTGASQNQRNEGLWTVSQHTRCPVEHSPMVVGVGCIAAGTSTTRLPRFERGWLWCCWWVRGGGPSGVPQRWRHDVESPETTTTTLHHCWTLTGTEPPTPSLLTPSVPRTGPHPRDFQTPHPLSQWTWKGRHISTSLSHLRRASDLTSKTPDFG